MKWEEMPREGIASELRSAWTDLQVLFDRDRLTGREMAKALSGLCYLYMHALPALEVAIVTKWPETELLILGIKAQIRKLTGEKQ